MKDASARLPATTAMLEAAALRWASTPRSSPFAIRQVGLFEPVLELALEEVRAFEKRSGKIWPKSVESAAIRGRRAREAATLRRLGYDGGLLSLAALSDASNDVLIEHCREVGESHSRSLASICSRPSADVR